MATGTIPQGEIIFYSLGSNKTVEITMYTNSCIYFAMRRGSTNVYEASMVEYWNSTRWEFGSGQTNQLTYSKSSDSRTFTLYNPGVAGAVGLIIIGAYISQYPS